MPAICQSFLPRTHPVRSSQHGTVQYTVSYGYQTVATCTCPAFTYGNSGRQPQGEHILVKWCRHLDDVRARVCHRVWPTGAAIASCGDCGGPVVTMPPTDVPRLSLTSG